MSELIENFKKEHSEIIEALKEVDELGILTKEGHAKLASIKSTLLEHLKEEDEKFYPVLREAARQNKELEEALEVFAKDLERISKFVLGFFDRSNKGCIGTNILRDFEILFLVIRNRMRNEENFLYDEFEELNKL